MSVAERLARCGPVPWVAAVMSESEPTQIGHVIRRRRVELGLSPAELGDKVGRTGSTVRRWEKDDGSPPAAMLPLLAKALELDPGQLTGFPRTASRPVSSASGAVTRAILRISPFLPRGIPVD